MSDDFYMLDTKSMWKYLFDVKYINKEEEIVDYLVGLSEGQWI